MLGCLQFAKDLRNASLFYCHPNCIQHPDKLRAILRSRQLRMQAMKPRQTMNDVRRGRVLSVPGFKLSYVHRDVPEKLSRRLKRQLFDRFRRFQFFKIFSTNRCLLRAIFHPSKLTFLPFPGCFFFFRLKKNIFFHIFVQFCSCRRHEQTGGLNGLKCRFNGDNGSYFARVPRDFVVEGRNLISTGSLPPLASRVGQFSC